jgi:hypothetical protein
MVESQSETVEQVTLLDQQLDNINTVCAKSAYDLSIVMQQVNIVDFKLNNLAEQINYNLLVIHKVLAIVHNNKSK